MSGLTWAPSKEKESTGPLSPNGFFVQKTKYKTLCRYIYTSGLIGKTRSASMRSVDWEVEVGQRRVETRPDHDIVLLTFPDTWCGKRTLFHFSPHLNAAATGSCFVQYFWAFEFSKLFSVEYIVRTSQGRSVGAVNSYFRSDIHPTHWVVVYRNRLNVKLTTQQSQVHVHRFVLIYTQYMFYSKPVPTIDVWLVDN